MEKRDQHQYFIKYNRNPWKANIPDCAIRATSLATRLPYIDVCKRLNVSFKNGHGLIRDSGIYLEKIKMAFDEYFDIVVDFDETINPEDIPNIDYDTASLFDDENGNGSNTELNLIEWMNLNAGQGLFLVGLHSPKPDGGGHLVCASTFTMQFFDTWDCSDWKVDAWMRVKKQAR